MIIIWGTTHAGKVDEVPGGMFHVVTRFGHLYYIPLFPTGSFVVLEKMADGGFSGAAIPLSTKSLLTGWLRGGCVVAMVIACVLLLFAVLDKKAGSLAWAFPVVLGGAAGAVLLLTYRLKYFREASYERAKQLAQHMGLNDTGLLMLEVAYGRMNAEQAQAELIRREEAQQPVTAEAVGPLQQ